MRRYNLEKHNIDGDEYLTPDDQGAFVYYAEAEKILSQRQASISSLGSELLLLKDKMRHQVNLSLEYQSELLQAYQMIAAVTARLVATIKGEK